jgi:transcriptional regulator with GAF, ATPase, and Fis domain
VTFHCLNLIDSVAESQSFGHVKGAFTDARAESLYYFRSGNGGTLFNAVSGRNRWTFTKA